MKNVVVIGFGLNAEPAISALSKSLPETHRLVIVTASPVAFYPPASLRASVVPGWEDKAVVDYSKFFPASSRHVVLANTRVTKLSKTSVTVDTAHAEKGFDTEIPFEYCVIASGSAYAFPARPNPEARSLEDVKDGFRALQNDIKSANSFLIVGGGPVGVEFAGEVKAQYPDKKVTLVNAASRLLEESPGMKQSVGDDLESQLKRLDVRVLHNTQLDIKGLKTGKLDAPKTFEAGKDERIEADFVLLAFGNKLMTSFVGEGLGSDALDSKGRVKVRQTLQLVDHDHIFAIGDMNDVDELKTYAAGKNQGPVCAANILSLLGGAQNGSLKPYKPMSPLMVVSCGPSGGAGQLFGFKIGTFLTSRIKSKSLFADAFLKTFHA